MSCAFHILVTADLNVHGVQICTAQLIYILIESTSVVTNHR